MGEKGVVRGLDVGFCVVCISTLMYLASVCCTLACAHHYLGVVIACGFNLVLTQCGLDVSIVEMYFSAWCSVFMLCATLGEV